GEPQIQLERWLCQLRPSPCKNEIVMYRITRARSRDSISMDARKIVDAREEPRPMIAPTPFTELNDVLRIFVESVRAALADTFVGAYLQGSFVIGDFDQHSD